MMAKIVHTAKQAVNETVLAQSALAAPRAGCGLGWDMDAPVDGSGLTP